MIPQRVNYAIKSSLVFALLDTLPEVADKLKTPYPVDQRPFEEVVCDVREAVGRIELVLSAAVCAVSPSKPTLLADCPRNRVNPQFGSVVPGVPC